MVYQPILILNQSDENSKWLPFQRKPLLIILSTFNTKRHTTCDLNIFQGPRRGRGWGVRGGGASALQPSIFKMSYTHHIARLTITIMISFKLLKNPFIGAPLSPILPSTTPNTIENTTNPSTFIPGEMAVPDGTNLEPACSSLVSL